MSVLDLPLVAAYREVIENALQQTETSRDLHDVVRAAQEIRERDGSEEGPIHDTVVDCAVRRAFVELVASLDNDESNYSQIWKLIDVANVLSDNELSEPGLGFYLIEELLDSQTIDGCRKVFDYLESRRERMVRKNFKNKSLVILRCCNELLRRLSRAEETVFCGRVFIYLFQTFPLGDRSSVNLRGVFHVENVTTYDETTQKSEDAIKPMDIDMENPQPTSGAHTPSSMMQDVDRTSRSTPSIRASKSDKSDPPPDLDALYPVFWSLQGLFSDPTRLFDARSMQTFKDGLNSTMSCFRYVAKSSAPSTEPAEIKRGLKRKRGGSDADGASSSAFNPKYLTSRDLFDLEIHDVAFRRHILVQALILVDFLLSLTPAVKAKTAGLTNKAVLYTYTLSEDDTKWAQSTRSSIASYLQQSGIGSEGSLYYRMVDTVLSRDKNWARWKAESCPAISRPPVDSEVFVEAQKALQQLSTSKPLFNPPGASELAFLSHVEPVETLKHPSARQRIPTLEEYYKGIQGDELDMEMAMDDQEKAELEEKKAGKLWRALRAAKGKRFILCEQIKNGENLAALIGQGDDSKPNGEADGEAEQDGEQGSAGKEDGPTTGGDGDGASESAVKVESSNSAAADEAVKDEASTPRAIDEM